MHHDASSSSLQEVFSQPLGLSKLALFLSAALRAKKKKSSRSRARPLVVATLTPSREMYVPYY
jgi:hypothetical protein